MSSQQDLSKYRDCMEELKKRLSIINYFLLDTNTPKTMSLFTDIEFLCLQFRKVLELIAFSSLTAHREEYEKAHSKYSNHWKADKILDEVCKINLHFYPSPIKCISKDTPSETIEIGFLTKDNFLTIFNKCVDFLHAWNPYNQKEYNLQALREEMKEWVGLIEVLLNQHIVWLVHETNGILALVEFKSPGKQIELLKFEAVE